MGGIMKRPKGGGHALPLEILGEKRLACGCVVSRAPEIASPKKWWCCGAYQRAKS